MSLFITVGTEGGKPEAGTEAETTEGCCLPAWFPQHGEFASLHTTQDHLPGGGIAHTNHKIKKMTHLSARSIKTFSQ